MSVVHRMMRHAPTPTASKRGVRDELAGDAVENEVRLGRVPEPRRRLAPRGELHVELDLRREDEYADRETPGLDRSPRCLVHRPVERLALVAP